VSSRLKQFLFEGEEGFLCGGLSFFVQNQCRLHEKRLFYVKNLYFSYKIVKNDYNNFSDIFSYIGKIKKDH
jgi:hypothetical protein